VPALPARPLLAEWGNLTVSPFAASLVHRPKGGR
jgi:hypothetical protein